MEFVLVVEASFQEVDGGPWCRSAMITGRWAASLNDVRWSSTVVVNCYWGLRSRCWFNRSKFGDELISMKETFGLCEGRAEQHYYIPVRAI